MEHPNRTFIPIEEQFRIMADTAPVMIWISGPDKLCYFFNAGWLHFTGRTMEQEYGNGWADGVHPSDFKRCLDIYNNSFDKREEFKMEYRLKRHDGQYRWLLDTGVPRFTADGSFAGYIGSCIDVNELLESEKIKNELAGTDAMDKVQNLNEELAIANEELAASNEELAAINEELSSTNEELKRSRKGLELLNEQLEDRVNARTKELKESERNFKNMILQAPISIGIFKGPEYVVEIANKKALELWGREFSEVVNKPILEAMPELQSQGIKELLDDVYNTGVPYSATDLPVKLLRDGKLVNTYINFIYDVLRDADGVVNGIMTIGTEVTEQVEIRKQVEKSEKRLFKILSQLPISVAVLRGPEMIIETSNKSILTFWKKTRKEVKGKPLMEVFPELEGQPFPGQILHVLNTGETISHREIPVNFDRTNDEKKVYYVDYYYQPLTNAEGEITSVLVTAVDVTDKVESREQLEKNADELQSINEEMTASNEELASTNEQLAEARDDLHEYILRLSESDEKLRQAINTGRMGTWSIDPDTLQVSMSDFIKQLFGFTIGQEVAMETIMKAVHPDYHQTLTDVLKNAMEKHEASDMEYPITNLVTGENKWVRATGQIFFDADGKPTEYSGLLMDITERKLDELRKNDFIAMVSHELKTPLTSLNAIVQILQAKAKNRDDAFAYEALDKASRQAKKMTSMINGFLNISRLESGKIQVNKQMFRLDELVDDVIAETKLTISGQTITLVPCGNVTVFADKDKIGSVISNLLSNAIKYSPKDTSIEVKCMVLGKIAQISVKDEGIGISQKDIKKLFDRYYRVENKDNRHISGFGIGLYLSEEIIRRHDGEIWVESELDKGSTFYFNLPLA